MRLVTRSSHACGDPVSICLFKARVEGKLDLGITLVKDVNRAERAVNIRAKHPHRGVVGAQ